MQRIQAFKLLGLVCMVVSGCGEAAYKSVGQHLHDIDNAREVIKRMALDPAKNATDKDYINASAAIARVSYVDVNKCWVGSSGRRVSTANTDHACLERAGFSK